MGSRENPGRRGGQGDGRRIPLSRTFSFDSARRGSANGQPWNPRLRPPQQPAFKKVRRLRSGARPCCGMGSTLSVDCEATRPTREALVTNESYIYHAAIALLSGKALRESNELDPELRADRFGLAVDRSASHSIFAGAAGDGPRDGACGG